MEPRLLEAHEADPARGMTATWHYAVSYEGRRFTLDIYHFPQDAAYRLSLTYYPRENPAHDFPPMDLWTFEDGTFPTPQAALAHGTALIADHREAEIEAGLAQIGARLPLIEAWIAGSLAADNSIEWAAHWWALLLLINLPHEDPERAWAIILEILQRQPPEEALGLLAAGPLEDLLSEHGPAFIERVEARARDDPAFKDLLRGVWRLSMSDEIWARVQAAQA